MFPPTALGGTNGTVSISQRSAVVCFGRCSPGLSGRHDGLLVDVRDVAQIEPERVLRQAGAAMLTGRPNRMRADVRRCQATPANQGCLEREAQPAGSVHAPQTPSVPAKSAVRSSEGASGSGCERHVLPPEGVLGCAEHGADEAERFGKFVCREVGQDAPPCRRLERVEGGLDVGEVIAGLEALARHVARVADDRAQSRAETAATTWSNKASKRCLDAAAAADS